MMKVTHKAIVEKYPKGGNPIQCIGVVDPLMGIWFEKNFTTFDVLSVLDIFPSTISVPQGSISAIVVLCQKDERQEKYYLINSHPDSMLLSEAYDEIKKLK